MIPAGKHELANNQPITTFVSLDEGSADMSKKDPVSEILTSEGCEYFADYVRELGLANDQDLVVLSSLHHYYYDAEEMKNVRTVISMKALNQVKEIKGFLHSLFVVMPTYCNFIGCFVDNKKVSGYELENYSSSSHVKNSHDNIENGIISQIPLVNMIYSFIDLRTYRFISASSVTTILNEHGFKVLGMKEINGITYFHSQKAGSGEY
jgi:hypothetical protein